METSTHRERMYEVPRWNRRATARNGGVTFASRDSARTGARKKAATKARRAAGRRACQEV